MSRGLEDRKREREGKAHREYIGVFNSYMWFV